MANPYKFRGDIDDDIARNKNAPEPDPTAQHTFDGEVCAKCGRTHDLFIPNTALPHTVVDQLSEFLDTLPEELLDSSVVPSARLAPGSIAHGFEQFLHQMRGINAQSSLVLAIATLMDKQTDGEVNRLYKTYMAEQVVSTVFMLRQILNGYISHLHEEERKGKMNVPHYIMRALDDVDEEVTKQIADVIEKYREVVKENGTEVDESIIDNGYPSKDRPFAHEMLVQTIQGELERQADAHNEHHHDDEHGHYHDHHGE